MSKGVLDEVLSGKITRRFPMIVALGLTSCLFVTTIAVDASAASGAGGALAPNRPNVETKLSSSWSLSRLTPFEGHGKFGLPQAATTVSVISTSSSSSSDRVDPTAKTSTSTISSSTSPPYRLDLGLEVESGLWEVAPVESAESAIGHKISIVMGYIGWSYPANESSASNFPTAQLDTLYSDGYLPEITWEPWNASDGVNQSQYSLSTIIDGDHDSYIQAWAQAAKSYGKPLLIRFAQEMNGTWYPWSERENGNSPGEYVAAWQHVHNIFVEDGVTNVKWIWSPDVVGPAASGAPADLAELYPGDAYVDYVGLDGYSYPIDGCPTASLLFGPTLAITNQLSDRPTMIAETGIDSKCSSETSLMASLLKWSSANSRIIALTFFDRDIASANYLLTSSLERTMHSLVTPLTMRSDDPDGFQS